MNFDLENFRTEKKLTQIEFCKIIGIRQSNYIRFVNDTRNGKDLNISIALNLSKHFGISLDEIYGITKEQQEAGLSATDTVVITPLEDDLLEVFRTIGENLGEPAQRAYLAIGESIAKNSQ